jgi:hypothetical protein
MEPEKKRSRAAFYCDACEVGFDYKSKYVRHVNSGSHKRYSSIRELGVDSSAEAIVEGPNEDSNQVSYSSVYSDDSQVIS